MKSEIKCPDCGGDVIYYHSFFGVFVFEIITEDEYKGRKGIVTRIVCANKCQGWKVIQETDHVKQLIKED